MKTVIVRYTVKPDSSEENQALIRKVFEELSEATPDGLKYMSMVSKDGLNFTHIAMMEDPSVNPLSQTQAFKAFTERIKDRCQVPPEAVDVDVVGTFEF